MTSLRLYAAALQDPLGIAQVAVRHAIDTQLCVCIPYLSGPNVFSTTRHNLYKAADQSRRARRLPAHHDV